MNGEIGNQKSSELSIMNHSIDFQKCFLINLDWECEYLLNTTNVKQVAYSDISKQSHSCLIYYYFPFWLMF